MENLRVPDSIKIAMQKAIMEFWRSNDEEIILPRDILPVIDSISRAFAISLSENPIVPNTREANILIQERIDTGQLTNSDPPAFATVKGVIEQWLRRMFLTPGSEVPEEIKDLLLDGADFIHGQQHADEANKNVIEAFRRGRQRLLDSAGSNPEICAASPSRFAQRATGCLCQVGCSVNGECPIHGDKATGK